ncbi:MAG: thioredoxin family protein [Phycisphaerales bacterium]
MGVRRWLACVVVMVLALVPRAAAQGDDPVTVSVAANVSQVAPGGEFVVAVVMEHQFNWHTHTNKPVVPASWGDFPAIPTEVVARAAEGVLVGPVQWPKVHFISLDLVGSGKPEKYGVFEGRAVSLVPCKVRADAAGQVRVAFTVAFQACDDSVCLMRESHDVEVTVPVGAETKPAEGVKDFRALDASVFADAGSFRAVDAAGVGTGAGGAGTGGAGSAAESKSSFFGIPVPQGAGGVSVLVLFLLAALGGLILNLTPCVLPVIPLKVMALSQHAGSPGRTLYLGAWMAAGVVAFWVGIGIPVIVWSSFGDPTRIFGIWWLTFGLGVVIAVLAVGLMGLFNLTLPQSVYMLNPKADTAHGSFLFGVMTAVLGLPCFGFVAGALLAAAATLPKLVTLVVFFGLGVGMALPYLLLAMKPGWVQKIPRTGPASELVKQVMGLLLIAAGLYFAGSGLVGLVAEKPYMARLLHWWAAAICGVIAAAWLVWRTFGITRSPARRAVFSVLGALIAFTGVWFVSDLTQSAKHSRWVPYSAAAFAEARAQGKVVVVDFTAEWCTNCKVLETKVLSKDPARTALGQPDVVQLVVDYSGPNPEGEVFQKSLNRKGIPLLAVYGPGTAQPWLKNAYTGAQLADAIAAARGVQTAATTGR